MARNPAFDKLLDEIKVMHDKKNQDYATDEDPLANLKNCTRLGLDPIVGTVTRIQDKMCRIESFLKKGNLVNESFRDSLIDLAVYSLLAVVILDEEEERSGDLPGGFSAGAPTPDSMKYDGIIRLPGVPGYWKNGIFYENGEFRDKAFVETDRFTHQEGTANGRHPWLDDCIKTEQKDAGC
jgi:hypothetical protein